MPPDLCFHPGTPEFLHHLVEHRSFVQLGNRLIGSHEKDHLAHSPARPVPAGRPGHNTPFPARLTNDQPLFLKKLQASAHHRPTDPSPLAERPLARKTVLPFLGQNRRTQPACGLE